MPVVTRRGLDHLLAAERAGACGDARVRCEERRAPQPRPAGIARQVEEVPQAFARADGDRVDRAAVERAHEPAGVGGRLGPPVALDVVDGGAAAAQGVAEELAPAVAAEDHDPLPGNGGERRQREQRFAVELPRGPDDVADAVARERLRARRADRRRPEARRPRAARTDRRHRLVDGVRADEDGKVVAVEVVGDGQQRTEVVERADLDRGKHHRLAAGRTDQFGEALVLAGRPRKEDPAALQAHSSAARISAAPRRPSSAASASPAASGACGSPRTSPRTTRAPSGLATTPRRRRVPSAISP